jgi:hypothetical protein
MFALRTPTNLPSKASLTPLVSPQSVIFASPSSSDINMEGHHTSTTSNYVYIQSSDHGWIPAKLESIHPETRTAIVNVPMYEAPVTVIRKRQQQKQPQQPEREIDIHEEYIVSDGGKTAKKWERWTIDLTTQRKATTTTTTASSSSSAPAATNNLPLQNVDSETGLLQVVPDMVDLPFLHEVCIKLFYWTRVPASFSFFCSRLPFCTI